MTVIESLIECVGKDGSIAMPSFCMTKPLELTQEDINNGLTLKLKILEPDSQEPSGMGVIADEFRKREDVTTGEGLFRVSAWGKDKDIIARKGFQPLIDNDEWAILIGVDIYRLSAMHYAEKHLPQEIKDIFQADKGLLSIYPKDKWYIETGVPTVKAWYKVWDKAYQNGCIKEIMIGESKIKLFKINDVISLYEKWLQKDPFGLYEIEKF